MISVKFADCLSTRGHPLKLLYPDARIDARVYSLPARVVSLWNRLPLQCQCQPRIHISQRATEMEITVRYGYAASPIGSLVWALTKGQVTGRGRLTGAGDGIHLTGWQMTYIRRGVMVGRRTIAIQQHFCCLFKLLLAKNI